MKYPNAYKGVKNIATGILLEVIIAIIGIVVVILARPGADANSVAAAGTLGLVVLIASIVAFIFELVGLFQAKKDEGSFTTALWMILFSIIISLAGVACSFIPAAAILANPICNILVDACRVVLMLSIIGGIANLAEKSNEGEFANSGRVLRMVLLGLFLMGLVLQIISSFVVNPTAASIMLAFAIIAGVVEIVADIWLVIYLLRAPRKIK